MSGTIQELVQNVSVIDDRVDQLGEATIQFEQITKDQLSIIGSIPWTDIVETLASYTVS